MTCVRAVHLHLLTKFDTTLINTHARRWTRPTSMSLVLQLNGRRSDHGDVDHFVTLRDALSMCLLQGAVDIRPTPSWHISTGGFNSMECDSEVCSASYRDGWVFLRTCHVQLSSLVQFIAVITTWYYLVEATDWLLRRDQNSVRPCVRACLRMMRIILCTHIVERNRRRRWSSRLYRRNTDLFICMLYYIASKCMMYIPWLVSFYEEVFFDQLLCDIAIHASCFISVNYLHDSMQHPTDFINIATSRGIIS